MLSYEDTVKSLGKHLIIHPLNTSKLRGASVDLTASKWAWSLKNKESVVSSGVNGTYITIKPNDCIVVLTYETVAIDNTLMGKLYSKSFFVAKGLSPISGLVDPGFIGKIILTLHNQSEQAVVIHCENDSITQISFDLLMTKTTKVYKERTSHLSLLHNQGIFVPEEYLVLIDNLFNSNFNLLSYELLKSVAYKEVLNTINDWEAQEKKMIENTIKHRGKQFISSTWYLFLLIITIITVSFLPMQEEARIFIAPSVAIIGMMISIYKNRKH